MSEIREKSKKILKKLNPKIDEIVDEIEDMDDIHLQHHTIIDLFGNLLGKIGNREICSTMAVSSAQKGIDRVSTQIDIQMIRGIEEKDSGKMRYIG